MTKSPLVSVLIPVFNGEKYIAEAIDSVLNQTFKNFELIVCDDGSNDNTAEIIKTYQDPRIILIEHPERKGIPISRNELLVHSKGKYVAWLDADDVANPTRLEVQVQNLDKNPLASCCLSNVEVFDDQNSYTTNFPDNPKLNKNVLFFRQPFFFSSCMAKNYRGETFDLFLKRTQDFDYLWELAQKGEVEMVNDILVKYRLVDHKLKPDFENTQTESFYTQKKRLEALGLECNDSQITALNKYLRDNKNCKTDEIHSALKIIQAVSNSQKLSNIKLDKMVMRAIYVYQVLKAIKFHSLSYFTFLKTASPKLIWQLSKMKM